MIPVISDFKDGNWDRPSMDISPKEKEKKSYGLGNARFIYSLFCKNQTAWGTNDVKRFTTNRLYSCGRQDVDQYKSFLVSEYNETSTTPASVTSWDDLNQTARSKRMGWYNINWQTLSPAPALMNNLHGQLDKMDFNCYVDTIDSDSKGLVEDEKYRRMVEARFADWQVEFKKKAGIPVDETMIYPRTQEEFDMFEAEDGFKLAVASTMQKLVRHSFEISRWDNVILKKVIDDLLCLGYAATRDYYNSNLRKWMVKYLDPAYLIAQYSNEYDYSDSDFFGYLHTDWTISRLREKIPEMTDEQAKQLASKSYNKYGNGYTDADWSKMSEIDPSTGTYKGINGLKIPVLECWWMDYDSEHRLYYRNRHGRDLVIDLGENSEVRPLSEESKRLGARQEVKKVGYRVPRECWWVLDTDYVFDHGKAKMPDRKSPAEPIAPFHVEQLLQPALIENIIPILDEITTLYLRYQNSLAMMAENGYTLNVGMLKNINYGGDTMGVRDIIKMHRETGYLLYDYISQSGVPGMYGGGAATPLTAIKGGLGERVNETISAMEFAFRKLDLFTGVSTASLVATQPTGGLEGTPKEAMQGTPNMLKPIVDAALEIKQHAGESMMRRIQIGLRNSEDVRNAYKGVVSPSDIDAMVEMERSAVEYGMSLKPKPDGKIKALFYKWMEAALQDTRDGNTGLYTSDAMYFTSRIEAGDDISDLTRQMRYRIKKNKEEKEQADMAQSQAQIQGNAQMQAQKHQMDMEKLTTEKEYAVKEELIRGRIKDMESNKQIISKLYEDLRKEAEAEQGITVGGKK